MRTDHSLAGRRIAVLAADGFEKLELTAPVKALRAAGARVDIVSLRRGRIRGVNLHEPASRVRVTHTVAEVDPDEYDGLLIPGGFINPDLLRQSAPARHFARAFDRQRKPIATLCHGPWLLVSAGIAAGRTLTSWPGVRDDLVNAGATWLDQAVVFDDNWVSSRGPQDLRAFVAAMKELFALGAAPPGGDTVRIRPTSGLSAPQRNSPPWLVLAALRFLPRPSLRTAALLATAAAATLWLRGRQRRALGWEGAGRRRLEHRGGRQRPLWLDVQRH